MRGRTLVPVQASLITAALCLLPVVTALEGPWVPAVRGARASFLQVGRTVHHSKPKKVNHAHGRRAVARPETKPVGQGEAEAATQSALKDFKDKPQMVGGGLPVKDQALEKAQGKDPLLIFWSVGSRDDVMDLVIKNTDHARSALKEVSVFLAHYDMKRQRWLDKHKKWYTKNVDNWAEKKGYKFQLATSLIGTNAALLRKFGWVWVLDEDCDFSGTDVGRMIQLADKTESLLVIPAFTQSTEEKSTNPNKVLWTVQLPHDECQYRYSPFIEVIFPLLRPQALQLLSTKCENCMHNRSVWGLDNIWCSWTARQLKRPAQTACAILDDSRVLHRNYQTLEAKYGEKGIIMQRKFKAEALREKNDVQIHHPEDWYSSPGDRSLDGMTRCVPHALEEERADLTHGGLPGERPHVESAPV